MSEWIPVTTDWVFSADGYFSIDRKTGQIIVHNNPPSGTAMPMPTLIESKEGKSFGWTERAIKLPSEEFTAWPFRFG